MTRVVLWVPGRPPPGCNQCPAHASAAGRFESFPTLAAAPARRAHFLPRAAANAQRTRAEHRGAARRPAFYGVFPAAVVALLLASNIAAQPAAAPAKPPQVPLWQLEPFDRIELFNGDVHDIDPVRIPPDTEFKVEPDQYIGRPGLPPLSEIKGDKRRVLYRIRLQDDGLEYYVLGQNVRRLSYYEDLLLAEARRLIDTRQMDDAYNYLRTVQDRDPKWPGFLEGLVHFHRAEADKYGLAGDWEKVFLALLEERRLQGQIEAAGGGTSKAIEIVDPVDVRIDRAVDQWTARTLLRNDYAEGRRIVARVESVLPQNPAARRWRAEYASRAGRLVQQAAARQAEGKLAEAANLLFAAVEIMPDLPAARSALIELFKRHSVLRVAVENLPGFATGPAEWSQADRRAADLLHVPLASVVTGTDTARVQSRILAGIEQSNINKRATLAMAAGLRWPGDGKPVTVIDVHRLLAQSCQVDRPLFHPGFARLVVNIDPELPDRLHIDFDRPQYQAAAWLQLPCWRIGRDPALPADLASSRVGLSGLGPFRVAELGRARADFRANEHYMTSGRPVLQQIIEQPAVSAAQRLAELAARRVELVADLPPRLRTKVASIPHARLVRMGAPRLHLLQFHYARRELRSRALRRAIDLAIDRPGIFAKLEIAADEQDRIVTGLASPRSFGYNAAVEPRRHDPFLAKVLIAAVRKELKVIGPLTLAHAGNETERIACGEIAQYLRRAGLEVRVIDLQRDPSRGALAIDLRYQCHAATDPVYDVVTLLTRDNPSLREHASAWLQHLLTELTQVPNESSARALLPELHRALHDDVAVLPLWQWTESLAVSDAVSGVESAPAGVYDGIENWKVEPRFPDPIWQTAPAGGSGR